MFEYVCACVLTFCDYESVTYWAYTGMCVIQYVFVSLCEFSMQGKQAV